MQFGDTAAWKCSPCQHLVPHLEPAFVLAVVFNSIILLQSCPGAQHLQEKRQSMR